MTDKKYDAFISYRHSELDRFVAEKIQRELENYKLPRAVKRNSEGNGKKKIERVFRDKDELPLASNLSDPINKALQNSEFLIVICTPRLPQSVWCKLEIDSFIAMHGRDHVLAILAEGEPEDSFPEQLLHEERQVVLPDGSVKTEQLQLEPLAADVRGKNRTEVMKNIRAESLRLLSVMFDVSYSDLRQRHREEKLKKIIGITTFAAVVCLAFGAVSWMMVMMIQKQAELLETQKMELQESNAQIQEQYWMSMSQNEAQVAENAMSLADVGRRREAAEMLLDVMPKSSQDSEIPFVPQANRALTNILGIYDTGYFLQPTNVFECSTTVSYMTTDSSGQFLLAGDEAGELYLYNVKEDKLLYQASTQINYLSEKYMGFIDEERLYYTTENTFVIYDFVNETEVLNVSLQYSGVNYEVSCCTDYIALFSFADIAVYQLDTMKEVYQIDKTSMDAMATDYIANASVNIDGAMLSGDTNYFVYYESEYSSTQDVLPEYTFYVLDTSTWEELCTTQITTSFIDQIRVYDGKLIISTFNSLDSEESKIIQCIDVNTGELCWENRNLTVYTDHMYHCTAWGSDTILIEAGRQLIILDSLTGETIASNVFQDDIMQIGALESKGFFKIWCGDGTYIIWNSSQLDTTSFSLLSINCSGEIIQIVQGDGAYFVSLTNNKEIIYYTYSMGENVEQITDTNYEEVRVSPDGKFWAGFDTDTCNIDIFDGSNNEKLYSYFWEGDYITPTFCFVKDSSYLAMAMADDEGTMVLFNLEDGTTTEFNCEELVYAHSVTFSCDGTQIIASKIEGIFYVDVLTGTVSTIPGDLLPENFYDYDTVYSRELEHIAYLNAEKESIEVFNLSTYEMEMEITIDTNNVNNILFCDNTDHLLVEYKDSTNEIYSITAGELCMRLDDGISETEEMFYLEEKDEYYIRSDFRTIVLNGAFSILEDIYTFQAYLPNQNAYLLSGSATYIVPKYNYDDLIEAAENF